jgi:Na+/H+ antiporter
MQFLIIDYIYLVLIILGLVMVANKIRLAYPIVLVVGGLLISLTGRFDSITIDPELVFLIFLPPLLYEAAWQISWKEFWKWRRIITSFAFPIVILTSSVVALASWYIIPGFTLALGFLLGGIVSPPDAVASTTILRQVKAPKILIGIVEGESLLNDASSLIVFRFALIAVVTGQFYFQEAAAGFFMVIVMGTLIGLTIGMAFYAVHRWLPTTSSIEVVLTLITPYCMYFTAEHYHYSGVLAVVAGGLLLSSKRQTMLDYRSRIEGVNVWTNLIFVLNGIIFLLIGLQLPAVASQIGDGGLGPAIFYGLLIAFVLIAIRMACTFGAALFTRFMSRFFSVADANPGWKAPVIFGWSGMRGVVSLAAALSIPLTMGDQPFPYRNLILFITFIVILVTLVFQGLTLPWLIRKVNLEENSQAIPEKEQETIIQKKMAHYSLQFLEEKYKDELRNEHLNNLYSRLKTELKFFNQEIVELGDPDKNSLRIYQNIYLEILEEQRRLLNKMNRHSEFDEDLIRKYHALIDLEEFKIRERQILEA